MLNIFFPILKKILIFLIIIYSAEAEDNFAIEIDNPKFSEKGLNDNIYEIKAERGLKTDNNLELFFVEGKFKTSDGTWIYLKADQGEYFQEKSIILLYKNITFYTDENETLTSEYAKFDLLNDIIEFSNNVSHESIDGTIYADKSKIMYDFNNIVYQGNVLAKIYIKN